MRFTESSLEEACLSWFNDLGYSILNGPSILPGELFSGRAELDASGEPVSLS